MIGGVNLTAYEGNSVSFNLLNRFQTQLRNSQQQSTTEIPWLLCFPLIFGLSFKTLSFFQTLDFYFVLGYPPWLNL